MKKIAAIAIRSGALASCSYSSAVRSVATGETKLASLYFREMALACPRLNDNPTAALFITRFLIYLTVRELFCLLLVDLTLGFLDKTYLSPDTLNFGVCLLLCPSLTC